MRRPSSGAKCYSSKWPTRPIWTLPACDWRAATTRGTTMSRSRNRSRPPPCDNTGPPNILTQLMPTVLSRLSVDSDADVVLPACMEMLRTDQALTPAVATYLLRATVANESKVLAAFDGLLSRTPYLTPWQAAWLTPVLVRSQSFATAAGGQARSNWLRSVWEDGRAPEPVRAAVASGLARHRLVTADDLLGAYQRVRPT